jgi:hypothetical protein
MSLSPCPHCARHVRVSAARCPFCGLEVSLTARPRLLLPRVGRAALFAAGATLAACGSSSPPEQGAETSGSESTDPSTPGPGAGDVGAPVALYGAPVDDGQGPPPTNGPADPGAPVAAYGTPAP